MWINPWVGGTAYFLAVLVSLSVLLMPNVSYLKRIAHAFGALFFASVAVGRLHVWPNVGAFVEFVSWVAPVGMLLFFVLYERSKRTT